MKRGEIWWARVDKRRPVVLLSRPEAYAVRAMVIVAPVSTTVRGFSVEVRVGKREGLPKSGVINCDWLVTLPRASLVKRAGTLSASKQQQIDDALRFALGLDA
ncbi:MAG: type II toxin-antitoxin system PemK/MazF family toxin [Myxococcota bacterium]